MLFARRQLFLTLTLLSLCACGTLGTQPNRPFNVNQRLASLSKEYFDEANIKSCMDSKDRACRDKILRGQIDAYNLVFGEFENAITKVSQEIHITGDVLAGLFGGAGTVIKSTQGKSIAAALASFVTGAKSSADTDLYFQKSITTIASRMEALRKEALLPIREGLGKETSDYPLVQALMDVEDYFTAGSMARAISSIDEASEQKTQDADAAKNDIINLTFGQDDNSALLRNFLKPGGKTDPDHAKALQDWIDKNVKPGLSKTSFIRAKEFADARKKAVEELINNQQ